MIILILFLPLIKQFLSKEKLIFSFDNMSNLDDSIFDTLGNCKPFYPGMC